MRGERKDDLKVLILYAHMKHMNKKEKKKIFCNISMTQVSYINSYLGKTKHICINIMYTTRSTVHFDYTQD